MRWEDLPPTPLDRYHMTEGGPWWLHLLVLVAVFLAVSVLLVLL